MALNTQSTQLAHQLGPSLSLAGGASAFAMGEYVLVRIPEAIHVDGQIDDEATAVSNLPLTSNGSSLQHFAFVRQMTIQSATSYLLEVYPVVSFIRSGGALAGYNQLDDAAKATLIPLPSFSLRQPTPEAFGPPLSFGNFATFRDSWLFIVPMRFIIPASRPFKRMSPSVIMPLSVLSQIDHYRGTLRMDMQITNTIPHYNANTIPHHHQPPPRPNDGNGDEQGSGNNHQGRSGDGGGQAASAVASVTSSPTIVRDSGGEKAGGAESEEFSFKTAHGILVLEGVDEDAEGADATMRDELIMLARSDPIWMKELRKYLQEEERERVQMQEERAMRLANWRDDIISN
ncbi:hypothetical protein D9615_009206 [Tricholomella constricta]|uniref:Uncharacterized protein n=1 Tax=Tricholomella constricta TaxID=117010 RepID=A0A8H5H2K8_9AGAR|nr:hypothetical protein D9615_009206 [Tricholomella constricta]